MADRNITGYRIFHGFLAGYINLLKHRDYVNRINVFPVADGDTGSNMVATLGTIIRRLRASRSAGGTLKQMADVSLSAARGNSGMILSQYINGLAAGAGGQGIISPRDFGQAAWEAVDAAYKAMDTPAEGTILTVLRTWAETVRRESREGETLAVSLSRGLAAAREELAATTGKLAVLKENRVTDAGAWGFVSFLEGMESMDRTGPVPLTVRRKLELLNPVPEMNLQESAGGGSLHGGDLRYRYCTEVLLEEPTAEPEKIKEELRNLGDSLIVGRGDRMLRVHIHTQDPAGVVFRMRRYGRLAEQKVDDMIRQEQTVHSRKGEIAVLTDSIADIPLELRDRYQIHMIPLNLIWDDESFLDRVTISPEEFYRMQAVKKSFPGSSVPEIPRVQGVYRFLLEHYRGILVLPVGKALSGTWQVMKKAAEETDPRGDRIRVLDTRLNSAALGLLVLNTGRKALEGAGLEDLEAFARDCVSRLQIFVSVATFRYMVRGGRVSPLKGLAATLLRMKPIVSLDSRGKGRIFQKAFTQKGLNRKIAGIIRQARDSGGIREYAVVHAAAPEKAARFARDIREITGRDPAFITDISPIVGMHSGRGAVALGILKEQA